MIRSLARGRFRRPLIALGALALAFDAQALSISGFKNSLVTFLLEKISVPGQFELSANTIESPRSGTTVLYGVSIKDARGEWMSAARLSFSWSPARLVKGEVQIDSIVLDRGHLKRLPDAPGEAPASDDPKKPAASDWPRSPITIHIPEIKITGMQISDSVLPQAIVFDATGALRDEGNEQSLKLDVRRIDRVEGLIAVHYIKRFDDDRLELRLDAREAAGGLVAAAVGLPKDMPAALKISGNGTPAHWKGELELDVEKMLAARGTVAAAWLERLGVDLTLNVLPGPRLAPAPRLAIGKSADTRVVLEEDDAGVVHVRSATISADALRAQVSGTFRREDSVLDLALSLDIDEAGARRLAPLVAPLEFQRAKLQMTARGPTAGLTVTGRGGLERAGASGFKTKSADIEFDVDLDDGARSKLAVIASNPTGPTPAWDAVLGQQARIVLATERHGERVVVESFVLTSAAMEATARGHADLGASPRVELDYILSAPELAPFAAIGGLDARGTLKATGRAEGPFDSLTTKGRVTLSKAVVNGQTLGRVDLDHTTRITEVIEGNLALKMDSPDFGPGRASTRFRMSANTTELDRLVIALLGIDAKGEMRLDAKRALPSGFFDFRIESLEPIGRLTGQALAGSGHGTARLPSGKAAELSVDAAFDTLALDEMNIGKAALEAKVSDLAQPRPNVVATMRVETLTVADVQLDAAVIEAAGPLDALNITARAGGQHAEQPFGLELAGLANALAAERTVELARFELAYASEQIALTRPATIRMAGDTFHATDFDFALPDDGRAVAAFHSEPAGLSADLDLTRVPLRLAKLFSAAPIEQGRLAARVRVNTSPSAPQLDSEIVVEGLQFEGAPSDTASLAVRLTTAWDARILDASLQVSGPFEPDVVGTARIALVAKEGAMPAIVSGDALSAALNWDGELAALFALAPLPDHQLTGRAKIAVDVTGTLAAPRTRGELSIREGRYENLAVGTIVQDLVLDSDFSDAGRIRLSVTGNDGVRGTLEAKGVIRPGEPAEMIDFAIALREMLLVRIDAAVARASADLKMKSSEEALAVSGVVKVDGAEIRLLNQLPPSIVEFSDVRIVGEPEPDADTQAHEPPTLVTLDVKVEMPGEIFVRGRGLDSEWGGNLQVSGSAAAPVVVGKIESRRGTLDLIGRVFTLEKGLVAFAGGQAIDPSLDIRLMRTSNDITGRVLVSGAASKPKLRFTSNPALPEEEVLPQLLFGRSRQTLSAPEALQLAAGVHALMQGEEGVLDRTRAALGVDVLRIESDDTGENAAGNLSVGRYATEKIYVGAKQSLDGRSSSVVVEMELPKRFVLDSEVKQDASTSVGITWRRDF